MFLLTFSLGGAPVTLGGCERTGTCRSKEVHVLSVFIAIRQFTDGNKRTFYSRADPLSSAGIEMTGCFLAVNGGARVKRREGERMRFHIRHILESLVRL